MRKTLFESLTRRPFTEKLAIPTDPEIARMAAELDVKARRGSAAACLCGSSMRVRATPANSSSTP